MNQEKSAESQNIPQPVDGKFIFQIDPQVRIRFNADGWVEVDKFTLQHVRHPNVFSLGDAGSSPNSKTGAAIRKQAPVVVDNIDSFLKNQPLRASYDGYSSCPIVTSSHAMLLAEFDYDLNLQPSFPLLDPTKPHRAYWYLKKYGLPFMYWNLMLKGLA